MRLCVAQIKPFKGDISRNIEKHKAAAKYAISNGAGLVIFPELSITGYEPELAKDLAITADDERLNEFQKICDVNWATIGMGVPLKSPDGITISMLVFQPKRPREVYSKKYIHADEEPFFIPGENTAPLMDYRISLGICYELSVPQHAEDAAKSGAEIYLTSVAKTAVGVEKAYQSLSETARKYSMIVMMANCVGLCDNFEAAGQSAAWNDKGVLLGQLDSTNEGLLILDIRTNELTKFKI